MPVLEGKPGEISDRLKQASSQCSLLSSYLWPIALLTYPPSQLGCIHTSLAAQLRRRIVSSTIRDRKRGQLVLEYALPYAMHNARNLMTFQIPT
jgi:hypothetical protein